MFVAFVTYYFPYGKTLRKYVSGDEERFQTTQHERDEETGLDYRGARYYDADIARFLSLDPLARDYAAWSPYNYVVSNPILLIDPTGKGPTPPGDYIDSRTGQKLGSDGLNDGKVFEIDYNSFANIVNSPYYRNATPEQRQVELMNNGAQLVGQTAEYQAVNAEKKETANPSNDTQFGDAAGIVSAGLDQYSNQIPKGANAVNKGVGIASTVLDGAEILENLTNGDYKEATVNTATSVFEHFIVDPALASPVPVAKVAAIAYYLFKLIYTPCPECGPADLPENWEEMRDQDNTRVGEGSGF